MSLAAADSRDRGGRAQPMLIARALKKYFPVRGGGFLTRSHLHAVDDVSFSLGKGETIGIVGESGCGKSTLARVVLNLIHRDAGELIFDGEAVGTSDGITSRDLRKSAQMVFQDSHASLNPRLSIEDTLAFGPMVHGAKRREAVARALHLLNLVGLDPRRYAVCYPHELSGGQRQRVNIARALSLEPRLVVMDEPVSALDKSVEAQVLNLLIDLRQRLSLTYLFISHDLNVVRFISDRVMVMYLGRVVEIGAADTIFRRAAHPYTQGLLASRLAMDPDKRIAAPPLSGDPPSPIDPAPGCRFAGRCPFVEEVCRVVTPELVRHGDKTGGKADHLAHSERAHSDMTHSVACHMADAASSHSRAGNA
jgi:peptide/nickel transport system ATP-binding protein